MTSYNRVCLFLYFWWELAAKDLIFPIFLCVKGGCVPGWVSYPLLFTLLNGFSLRHTLTPHMFVFISIFWYFCHLLFPITCPSQRWWHCAVSSLFLGVLWIPLSSPELNKHQENFLFFHPPITLMLFLTQEPISWLFVDENKFL